MKIVYERVVKAQEIVVSPRPIWKCRTCQMFGKGPSCPPDVPSWEEARKWINSFESALVAKFGIERDAFEEEKRSVLEYLLKKEKMFFSEGNPFALSLFSGNCNLCDECKVKNGGRCSYPTKVRPSVDAIGIEIGSIAKIDFNEDVLYGLILID